MLYKTRGIVLNYLKYKESSIICKILTEQFGLQSYIINGARTVKGKNKIALYQPLSLLDLVVYNNDKKTIQRISEAKTFHLYNDIPQNVYKSSIAIFITEILLKCSSSETNQDELFQSLIRSFILLDQLGHKETSHFPIYFLINYLKQQGYISTASQVADDHVQLELLLSSLETEESLFSANINNINKRICLDQLILFYKEHFGIHTLKSLDVLKELF